MTWTAMLLTATALAGTPNIAQLEERVTGAVFVEAGGPGWIYSVNGQMLIPTSFGGVGVRAGGAFLAVSFLGPTQLSAYVPVGLTLRAGHRPWALEGGVAVTPMWFNDDWGPWSVMLAPMLGLDHRAPSGLLFGAHVQLNVGLPGGPDDRSLGSHGPFPWGGVRVGYWFPRKD